MTSMQKGCSNCVGLLLGEFGIYPDAGVIETLEESRKAVLSKVIPLVTRGDKPASDGLGEAFSGEGK